MSRVHEEIHKAIFDFLKSILSPCFRDIFCLTIDKSTNKKIKVSCISFFGANPCHVHLTKLNCHNVLQNVIINFILQYLFGESNVNN